MSLAFVDRPPTLEEFEKFRLILSTYQDGFGMLVTKDGKSFPGWRDFERSVAAAFGGVTQESKAIFDVLIPNTSGTVQYGISCKMRSELNRLEKDGRITIELSNSVKKFQDHLALEGIEPQQYTKHTTEIGRGLVELVEKWKESVSLRRGGQVDLEKSCYLTLMYNKARFYQLFWFSLQLPDPSSLHWYYPDVKHKGKKKIAGHLNGDDKTGGRVFEWYSSSGGQLKYYPLASSAIWASERFKLEPIPKKKIVDLATKAKTYFPKLWTNTVGA
jgi:hypothetical protein